MGISRVVLTKESLVFLLSSSPVIFSVSLCFLSMQSFVDGYYFLGNCGKTSGQRIKPQTEESPLNSRLSQSLSFTFLFVWMQVFPGFGQRSIAFHWNH